MAKGALATGALTLGTGAFGTATVGAQQEQVAVFANNYYPGANFDVIDQLQTGTTVDILQVDDETVSEISQPDEWIGHLIRYEVGAAESGITTFLFLRGQSLSADDSGTIGEDAAMLSSQLNLLSTSLDGGGDGGDTADDQPAEEETTDDGGDGAENETADDGDEGAGNETADGNGGN